MFKNFAMTILGKNSLFIEKYIADNILKLSKK